MDETRCYAAYTLLAGEKEFRWFHTLPEGRRKQLREAVIFWRDHGILPDWARGPLWELVRSELQLLVIRPRDRPSQTADRRAGTPAPGLAGV